MFIEAQCMDYNNFYKEQASMYVNRRICYHVNNLKVHTKTGTAHSTYLKENNHIKIQKKCKKECIVGKYT